MDVQSHQFSIIASENHQDPDFSSTFLHRFVEFVELLRMSLVASSYLVISPSYKRLKVRSVLCVSAPISLKFGVRIQPIRACPKLKEPDQELNKQKSYGRSKSSIFNYCVREPPRPGLFKYLPTPFCRVRRVPSNEPSRIVLPR